METQLSEFADEYIADRREVAKYKQSRNISVLFGFFAFLTLFLWFARIEIMNQLPQTISAPEWAVMIVPLLFVILGYTVRRGRKNMDIDSSTIALHELSMSIKRYSEEDCSTAVTHFADFAEEVNRTSNELFSERKEELAEEYAERLDGANNKQAALDETYEEFVLNLVNDLRDEQVLSETVGKVEDKSEINTSSVGIVSDRD